MGQKPPPGLGLVMRASDNEPVFLVSISQAGSMHIPQVAQHVEQGVRVLPGSTARSRLHGPQDCHTEEEADLLGMTPRAERRPKDVYRRADLHRTQPGLPRRGPS